MTFKYYYLLYNLISHFWMDTKASERIQIIPTKSRKEYYPIASVNSPIGLVIDQFEYEILKTNEANIKFL